MTDQSTRPFYALFVASLLAAVIVGCTDSDSGTRNDGAGSGAANVEFPDGDPSVSAADGGPGFTGEGWTTATPYPLGDPKAVKGGAIRSHISEWPGNLRMAGSGSNTALNYLVGDLCYQGLLSLDPNTLEFIPQLASHWKISEDQMTFTYRINPRAHWSDGKPVVAADVVATWTLMMDPTLQEPSNILTYGKFHKPVAKTKYIVEVTAKDKNWRNFLYFSAALALFPAHEIGSITGKEYLDKYNYAYTASTGPYIVHMRDVVKGKSVTITRREDFWAINDEWNKGRYNFDKIRFEVVPDPQLAFQKVCKGDLDFFNITDSEWWAKDLPNLPAVQKGWLARQKIFNDAPNIFAGFAMNTRTPPLDDLRVRKALQYLYQRDVLIEKLDYNESVPTNSHWPGSEYENPDNEHIAYDPQKADELLRQAGWSETGPDGVRVKNGQRLSLTLTWYNPITEKFLTSFKETCSKVGVEILLDRSNRETMWKNLMERKFQMVHMRWGGLVFPNPETSLHSTLADQNDNNNITGFKNARCDELFEKYDAAFTQDDRRQIIREIDKIFTSEYHYAMEWYLPCQRILYWNKFGIPEFGLPRVSDWDQAYVTWWIDPDKAEKLRAARQEDAPLPIPPLEIHYWEQHKDPARQANRVEVSPK
ncbi:MAG: ABC transporter substrate-binding protein [Planctomycetaceae bacterium]